MVDVCRGAVGPKQAGQAELWAQPAVRGVGRLLARAEELPGSARFVRLVQPHLDRGDARPSLVARALATLAPALQCICTTNLDAALERGIGGRRSRRSRPTSRRPAPRVGAAGAPRAGAAGHRRERGARPRGRRERGRARLVRRTRRDARAGVRGLRHRRRRVAARTRGRLRTRCRPATAAA